MTPDVELSRKKMHTHGDYHLAAMMPQLVTNSAQNKMADILQATICKCMWLV